MGKFTINWIFHWLDLIRLTMLLFESLSYSPAPRMSQPWAERSPCSLPDQRAAQAQGSGDPKIVVETMWFYRFQDIYIWLMIYRFQFCGLQDWPNWLHMDEWWSVQTRPYVGHPWIHTNLWMFPIPSPHHSTYSTKTHAKTHKSHTIQYTAKISNWFQDESAECKFYFHGNWNTPLFFKLSKSQE